MAHFSHAYPEGVSIYFSIAGSARGQDEAEARYSTAWARAMDVVMASGCTVSHHHGVGRMKAPYVTREQGDFVSLFTPLKERMDPDGLLNPGKLCTTGQEEREA
jgi:alkyldihydroxyacetonephosphate synthase